MQGQVVSMEEFKTTTISESKKPPPPPLSSIGEVWHDPSTLVRPLLLAEMEKYGLSKAGWKVDFDMPRATKKRYQVDWEKKTILLAQRLKNCANHADIRNVLLLAIAVVHVGPYAGEAATLDMYARLGGNLVAYNKLEMVKPAQVRYCTDGCYAVPVHKRSKGGAAGEVITATTNRLCGMALPADGSKCQAPVAYGLNNGTNYIALAKKAKATAAAAAAAIQQQQAMRSAAESMVAAPIIKTENASNALPSTTTNLPTMAFPSGTGPPATIPLGKTKTTYQAQKRARGLLRSSVDILVPQQSGGGLKRHHATVYNRLRPRQEPVRALARQDNNEEAHVAEASSLGVVAAGALLTPEEDAALAVCARAAQVLRGLDDVPDDHILLWLDVLSNQRVTYHIIRTSKIGTYLNLVRQRRSNKQVVARTEELMRMWQKTLAVYGSVRLSLPQFAVSSIPAFSSPVRSVTPPPPCPALL